ncbi:hypothetical protein NUU61_000768 [Penicillium alfredii]|uniref:Alcohol dehydrogenase N-terminal domain-containing protein n=1 Tax=Penicillium alfredii TaxID=1506179 RepID=A0A9W9GAN3_9EURO|nr:uncharacterized protein NUU61_000768 [Penicillium alfredii]KAJ5115009.1 hypothetical protein NUU61_000768 [Penicillium alfredii]
MYYTFNVFRGSESGKVIQDQITRPLNSNDVLLEVTHGSLCGTDELYIRSPQVLGHEGAGIVKEGGISIAQADSPMAVGIPIKVPLGHKQSGTPTPSFQFQQIMALLMPPLSCVAELLLGRF